MKNAVLINQEEKVELLIEAMGYAVFKTNDPLIALRMIFERKPNLIISDFKLGTADFSSILHFLTLFQLSFPVVMMVHDQAQAQEVPESELIIAQLEKSEVSISLESIILKGLKNFTPKRPKYEYVLRQREWTDLMSQSDRKRILVVDDSQMIRRFNLSCLDESGEYELYSAENGLDAVLKALLIKPDLILTDIEMPVLGGVEMSQIFYMLNQPFPLVFLAGSINQELQAEIKEIEGVLGYLLKTELKDTTAFLGKIKDFMMMAVTLEESLQESFSHATMASFQDQQKHLLQIEGDLFHLKA